MSLLSQPLFSTRVRTGITRLHLVSFRLHLQATQRGTWHLAQEQLQWHLLATRNLYTIVKILVKAAPTKILVPNVWNPSYNRYLIISLKYLWSSVLQIFSSFQSFHDSGSLFRGNIWYVAGVYRDGIDHVLFLCMLD